MLGEWIRGQREQQGWSQSELARRAGISATAINLLENNKRRQPQADTAKRIAGAFGVTVEEMYRAAYGDSAQDTQDPELQTQWERLPGWKKRLALLLLEANLSVQQERAQLQPQVVEVDPITQPPP